MHTDHHRLVAILLSVLFIGIEIVTLSANVSASWPLASPIRSPLAAPNRPIPGERSANTAASRQNTAGAYIQLGATVPSTWVGATASVQWRNAQGQWQTVSGWQNTLTAKPTRWWVSPQEFGAGVFRWVVIKGGKTVAESRPFYLPKRARDTLIVRAT
jgi:hypothetical protein